MNSNAEKNKDILENKNSALTPEKISDDALAGVAGGSSIEVLCEEAELVGMIALD